MTEPTTTIPTDAVAYVKELYPRLRPDDGAIERYRDAIDNLPPIVIAKGRVLVDGYHRWQAHVREGRTEIQAIDLGDITDTEILSESIRRNASHGQQLSTADKKKLAATLWGSLGHLGDERVPYLAELLSVSHRSVERYTKEARQGETEALKFRQLSLFGQPSTERLLGRVDGFGDGVLGVAVEPQVPGAGLDAQHPMDRLFGPPTKQRADDVA